MSRLAAPYLPRRPLETVLHRLVAEHGMEMLEHAEAEYEGPLPKYVVDEMLGYLACGDFSRGFVFCRCDGGCGCTLLVALSCKKRGLCPSCAGRRMADVASHLVDRVFPSKPVRQYVLSFPHELSRLAAIRPEVLAYLCRVFWEAVERRYTSWAKGAGYTEAVTGAVTGVHYAEHTIMRSRAGGPGWFLRISRAWLIDGLRGPLLYST